MDPRKLMWTLLKRAEDDSEHKQDQDAGQKLLDLLSDPFADQLSATSVVSALAVSLPVTALIVLLFSFLRPYHQAIYAPKVKHADEKHAPPAIGKSPWAWVTPVMRTNEDRLITQVGMDATIFIRFIRMCRNMFLVLALIGVSIIVPVNVTHYQMKEDAGWIMRITPLNVWGTAQWSQVALAWLFDIVIISFLWWNYRKVFQLRRAYFESDEYQHSLHSRTLMLYDLPKDRCSDEGIARVIDEVVPNSSFARTAIARNVKDLPELIAQHDKAVRKLEEVLAKYLKNPANLPPRPSCSPSKKDPSYGTYPKGQKIDAIEYYTSRIRHLETLIKEVRASVDKRSTMPYGFASYADIVEAHNIAYACRKKKPHGATITLAPRPNDIIWNNMALSSTVRSRRAWVNNLWIALLTFFWIAPNAMIAVFLVNLGNLGKVWKAFNDSLSAHTTVWGIVQGIFAPALTSLIYLILPIIFRRLAIKAGDQTKTGRERHVLGKLYAFFVFNNLIVFSLFSVVWTYVAGVQKSLQDGDSPEKALFQKNIADAIFQTICKNSPFWVAYLVQRQLGATLDLVQLWPLIHAFFLKRFSSPTPRELIELTAPPPFEYASYYNYFLFYVAVTLCYAGIQPLVLLATAMYFCVDVYMKKYLILYRFVTKTESGGAFWRVLFNRLIFASVLANLVVLLTLWVRGDGNHIQFYSTCPLPFIMIGFKFYCQNAFDAKIRYYSTLNIRKHPENGVQKENRQRSEKLASRFGHPALYKPLITPMVHQRAQNLLPSVYTGRLTDGRENGASDGMTISGYSDMYALDAMQGGRPGKSASGVPGFEYVAESQMDFEHYKNRMEFAEDHGGGEIYGRPGEIVRPNTPGSFDTGDMLSRPGTPGSGRGTPFAPGGGPRRGYTGMSETTYQHVRQPSETGYMGATGPSRFASPPPMMSDVPSRSRSPFYAQDNTSGSALVQNAAEPPFATPGSMSRDTSLDRGRMAPPRGGTPPVPNVGPAMGNLRGGPRGYSGLAQSEDAEGDVSDPAQYDYFRGGNRSRRAPGQGW